MQQMTWCNFILLDKQSLKKTQKNIRNIEPTCYTLIDLKKINLVFDFVYLFCATELGMSGRVAAF